MTLISNILLSQNYKQRPLCLFHRAHSSASFEKYLSELNVRDIGGAGGGGAMGGAGGGVTWSGMSTPRRRLSGGLALSRGGGGLGHDPSGGTPMSTGSCMMSSCSRASWEGAGTAKVYVHHSHSMYQRAIQFNFIMSLLQKFIIEQQ